MNTAYDGWRDLSATPSGWFIGNSQPASAIGCPECCTTLSCAVGASSTAGLSSPDRRRRHRPTGPRIKALRSSVEAYGRLVAPAVFNTDVVE
jgi:hypothetical protein